MGDDRSTLLRRELLQLLGMSSLPFGAGSAMGDTFDRSRGSTGHSGGYVGPSRLSATGNANTGDGSDVGVLTADDFLADVIGKAVSKIRTLAIEWMQRAATTVSDIIDTATELLGDVADEFRPLADLRFLFEHGQEILDEIASGPEPGTETPTPSGAWMAGFGFDIPSPGDITSALGDLADETLEAIEDTYQTAKNGIYSGVEGVADTWDEFKDHLLSLTLDGLIESIAGKIGDVLTTVFDGMSGFIESALTDPDTSSFTPSFGPIDADLPVEVELPMSLPTDDSGSPTGDLSAMSTDGVDEAAVDSDVSPELDRARPWFGAGDPRKSTTDRHDARSIADGSFTLSGSGIPSKLSYFAFSHSVDVAENRALTFEFGQPVPIQIDEHRCAGAGQLVGMSYKLKIPMVVGEIESEFWAALGPQPNCLYLHMEPSASLSATNIMNRVKQSQIEKYAIGHWTEQILGAYSEEMRAGVDVDTTRRAWAASTDDSEWTYQTVSAYLDQLYEDLARMPGEIDDEVRIDVDHVYSNVGRGALQESVDTTRQNVADVKASLESFSLPSDLQAVQTQADSLGLDTPDALDRAVSISAPLRADPVDFSAVPLSLPRDIEAQLTPIAEWLVTLRENDREAFEQLDSALGSTVDLASFLSTIQSASIPQLQALAQIQAEVNDLLDTTMLDVLHALTELMEFKYELEWPFPIPCERLCFDTPRPSEVPELLINAIAGLAWYIHNSIMDFELELPSPLDPLEEIGTWVVRIMAYLVVFAILALVVYGIASFVSAIEIGFTIGGGPAGTVAGAAVIAILAGVVISLAANAADTDDTITRDNGHSRRTI